MSHPKLVYQSDLTLEYERKGVTFDPGTREQLVRSLEILGKEGWHPRSTPPKEVGEAAGTFEAGGFVWTIYYWQAKLPPEWPENAPWFVPVETLYRNAQWLYVNLPVSCNLFAELEAHRVCGFRDYVRQRFGGLAQD